MALFGRPTVNLLLVIACGFLTYSNTFHVPFVFDDDTSIVNNPVIRNLENFFLNGTGYSYNPRRFIGYLSVALNYRLGGLDVTGYHIFNLGVHITTACLVYAFIRLTLQTPFFGTRDSGTGNREPGLGGLLPLLAALLFVVHPVQSQAVTYIIQRLASLATLFYLASLVLYAKGRLFQVSADSAHGKAVFLYLAASAAAALAMQTKEIAITLPIVVAAYEFYFFRMTIKKKAAILLLTILALSLAFMALLHAGKPLGEFLSDVTEKTRLQTDMPRLDYFFTQLRVIVTYLRLLVLPVRQNLDYDYPVYHTLFTPPVFLSFMLILALTGLALYLFIHSKAGNHEPLKCDPSPESRETSPLSRLISFGILWFFITLSVESSVIPIVDVIFEHRLYLPSVGAAVAAAALLSALVRKYPGNISLFAVSTIVLFLAVATWQRNTVWQDPLTLWADVVSKSPGKPRPHLNLGGEFLSRGRIDESIEQFQTAVRLRPDYSEAYSNLGAAYNKKGLVDEAIEQLRIALRINPDNADALNNAGTSFAMKGFTDYAVAYFHAAVRLQPADARYHQNLARAYEEKGWLDKAREELRIAAELAQ